MGVRLAKPGHLPCGECRRHTLDVGHEQGRQAGYDEASFHVASETGYTRGAVIYEVGRIMADAHREAKHGGRWEFCTDPVCAAMERFIHFETRPEAIAPRTAIAAVVR